MTGHARRTIQRFVVKVGSSVLTDDHGHLLPKRIEQLAEQVAACLAEHRQPLLVSSGAIACGMAKLGLQRRPTALAQLQACAAIGQGELMHLYTKTFAKRGLLTAQVLLTQDDLANRARFRNAKQTLLTLLHRRVIPVINENDTVAVEEITFGDNDRLAALVAVMADAELVVILSDVDGFLQGGKLVERVDTIGKLRGGSLGPGRATTKGGMASKLEAARIAGHSGIPLIIANGTKPGVLTGLFSGQSLGTLFVPQHHRLSRRKWWIAFSLRQPKGSVVIDEGASAAIQDRGKSLLALGVQAVKGRFEAGSCVSVADAAGTELARGLCNVSSAELTRLRGLPARIVIHRKQLVLARELAHP